MVVLSSSPSGDNLERGLVSKSPRAKGPSRGVKGLCPCRFFTELDEVLLPLSYQDEFTQVPFELQFTPLLRLEIAA